MGFLRLAHLARVRQSLDDHLSILLASDAAGEETYSQVLRWKGLAFREQRRLRQIALSPNAAAIRDKLQTVASHYALLAFCTPESGNQNSWRRELLSLALQKDRLESDLAAELPGDALADESLGVEQLLKAIPAGTALVDFLQIRRVRPPVAANDPLVPGEVEVVAWVVRPDEAVQVVSLGPLGPIEAAINEWNEVLGADKPGAAAGSKIKSLVWQRVAPHLEDCKTILISPDGALSRLPFASLPGREEKAGAYLLDEFTFVTVPFAAALAEARVAAAEPPGDKFLLLGDVDFDAPRGALAESQNSRAAAAPVTGARALKFPKLDHTRGEIVTIRDTFEQRFPQGQVQPLRGAGATERAFREIAGKQRWMHLATHGFFAPPEIRTAVAPTAEHSRAGDALRVVDITGFHPDLLSGLALAGANLPPAANEDDGILTALEISGLDLTTVDLAVLSACQTGRGETAGGEGVLGLQRAFQVAGAKTSVVSLWELPDLATSLLMQRFYENLWRKQPDGQPAITPAAALREAQRWLMREGSARGLRREPKDPPTEEKTLPPYYWAGFLVSGQP